MTKSSFKQKSDPIIKSLSSIIFICLILFFAINLSDKIGQFVLEGIKLSLFCVIPSAFPFMILSELYINYGSPEKIPMVGTLYENLFHLPKNSLSALICGNVCGFPIGVKSVSELYKRGEIEEADAEKLLAYSNNPSPSFIIGAVGVGILQNKEYGILLLISLYLSVVLSAVIFRGRKSTRITKYYKQERNINLITLIKDAGFGCLTISSFIIFFSIITSVVNEYVSNSVIKASLISVLEVTNAVKFFSILSNIDTIRLSLISFALGFGGLSVFMQSKVFASGVGLSMKKYIYIKFVQGVISFLITFTLLTLSNIQ